MKRILIISVFVLIVSLSSSAQEKEKPVFQTNIEATVGYVPKSEFDAFKTSFGVNNLVFKRFGAYTSFEKNSDKDYSMNIMGITGSINDYLYLWGGIDLFSEHGLINQTSNLRSEMGLGVLPYKWTVIRLGWSSTVGTTIAIGIKINL